MKLISKFLVKKLNVATIVINNKNVLVEWTESAEHELNSRTFPLIVELELYFSCLVKKFIHFYDSKNGREVISVTEKLAIFFRPVTSESCSIEKAEKLGRQPEIELFTLNVRKIAPTRVRIDFCNGNWKGEYWL